MNRTKIMATIGPASWDEKTLEQLIMAGVSSCRLNFSHTNAEQAERIIASIRKISRRLNRPLAIRQDLQGPKIRLGSLQKDSYELPVGHEIIFTRAQLTGDESKASIPQAEFIAALSVNDEVILGDNDIKLVVIEKINPDEIRCRVVLPGTLRPRKGAAAPDVVIPFKGLTPKDIEDFQFCLALQVDCVSMSFVQTPDDLELLRAIMAEKNFHIPIIAKIEQQAALRNIDTIIARCDGISIARGDLAVVRPVEELHLLVKELIRRCHHAGKFVFAGSGILSSLKHCAWPTRAEVGDVASLVLDGVDALSFSDETAVGDDPVGSVRVLSDIIARCESAMLKNLAAAPDPDDFFRNIRPQFPTINGAQPLIFAADHCAPAARLAKMHYTAPLIAAVRDTSLANYLAHYWGLYPLYCPAELSGDALLDHAEAQARKIGIIRPDDQPIRL